MLSNVDFNLILPSSEGWRTYSASKLLVAKISESFFIKLFGLLSILIVSCGILFEDGLDLTTALLATPAFLIVLYSSLLSSELKATKRFFDKKKRLKCDHSLIDFFSLRMKGGIQLVVLGLLNVLALMGVIFMGNVSDSIFITVEIMAFVYLFIALASVLKIVRLKKIVDTPSKDLRVVF